MALPGKKERLSERQMSKVLVTALYEDISVGYPEIVRTLKELPYAGKSVHSLRSNSVRHFITAVFSMELLSIAKTFDEDQGSRIMKLCIDELRNKLGVDEDDICSSVDRYVEAFPKGLELVGAIPHQFSDPLQFVSEILYEELGLEKIEVAGRNVPFPILVSAISLIVVQFGGYVKKIKANYEIVKGYK